MKKLYLAVVLIFLCASVTLAAPIFSEDFSGADPLDDWNVVYGEIASDPLDSGNTVLNFSHYNTHGDSFSPLFSNSASIYWITFDYYSGDTTLANGGGFFGIDQDGKKGGTLGGPNGSHIWFLGTPVYGSVDYLPQSNGKWQHIVYSFSVPASWEKFSLMFEDFRSPASDAYFDNINLYDYPVPEPTTFMLFGLGLALAFWRRRKA